MKNGYVVLQARNISYKMTYGKKKHDNETIREMQVKARSFVIKTFGLERLMPMNEAIELAKKKKPMDVPDFRTFVLCNSGMNRFNSGFLLVFDKICVRIINYKKQEFETLAEGRWIICKKFSLIQDADGKYSLFTQDDSTCLPEEDGVEKESPEFYTALCKLDPIKSESQCKIGRVMKVTKQLFNKNGKRYEDGHYVYIVIEERETEKEIHFRLWSSNMASDDMEGKLVLVATTMRKVKEDQSSYYALTVIQMKPYKRKSIAPADATLTKMPKCGGTSKGPGSSHEGPKMA